MNESEVFSQKRMNRCSRIKIAIMDNWRKTNSFTYTVRATCPIEGMTLNELRKQYFAIGVAEDLTEIPLIDMLVVFSMIAQESKAFRKITGQPPNQVKYHVATSFSDDEAARLLAGIVIATPFDKGKRLRVAAVRKALDDPNDSSS